MRKPVARSVAEVAKTFGCDRVNPKVLATSATPITRLNEALKLTPPLPRPMHPAIADIRLTAANDHDPRPGGRYVLYWMIAQRRMDHNFALQHAVNLAVQFRVPLLIFEPLRTRYRWASDRIHRFVIEGMRDNQVSAKAAGIAYYPYVEPRPGVGTPLLHRLAADACVVVTDEYPCFFLPKMIEAVRDRIPARLELVDSNGVMPLRRPGRSFTVAHSYRRWMQKNILPELESLPEPHPIADLNKPVAGQTAGDLIDPAILKRWPAADLDALIDGDALAAIPIDHSVPPAPGLPGGSAEAARRLDAFLSNKLARYHTDRNHPDQAATTGLSAHLHFGHVSPHEMVARVLESENWRPEKVSKVNGKQSGFFGVSEPADAILEQLLTWRELGFNIAFHHPDTYDTLDSLPDWAKKSHAATGRDPREHTYMMEQFEAAATHDPLWNAAQRELVQTGIMQNYVRMLWGKMILAWSPSAAEALDVMVHLNNKYALDGRDPNSYCGILWVLGRTDRAWGPKRPVFGSVRYMTSASTKRKLQMTKYLQRFGAG